MIDLINMLIRLIEKNVTHWRISVRQFLDPRGLYRSETVFECYKDLKRRFRCLCRKNVQSVIDKHIIYYT